MILFWQNHIEVENIRLTRFWLFIIKLAKLNPTGLTIMLMTDQDISYTQHI